MKKRGSILNKTAAVTAAAIVLLSILSPVSALAASVNELTGEPEDDSLAGQRPIAVMVDNDAQSLPHYGTGDADIVYEMVNSTANNRITRLMCVYKDWNSVPQIGNIRSTRPTNVILAEEYNAVLIHDGGPFYIDPYLADPFSTNISAGFTRVNNGKRTEFTEYVMAGEVMTRMAAAGIPAAYTAFPGSHFNFGASDLSAMGGVPALRIALPFYKNSSQLVYNALTGMYDYYEYGRLHTDAGTGRPMSFRNVFIQNCDILQLDRNGYLIYNCIADNKMGYYCTGGYTIPVFWRKYSAADKTRFYYMNGQEITVNTGKSYIGLVPGDSFAGVTFN